jgi:cupin domain
VLMGWHKPGEGPPDHVHFDQEEIFFIIEGSYEMTVDGHTSTAGPGTIVFIPRNVVHRFRNVGETTARLLDWTLPGGQDHYSVGYLGRIRNTGCLGAIRASESSDASAPMPPKNWLTSQAHSLR